MGEAYNSSLSNISSYTNLVHHRSNYYELWMKINIFSAIRDSKTITNCNTILTFFYIMSYYLIWVLTHIISH